MDKLVTTLLQQWDFVTAHPKESFALIIIGVSVGYAASRWRYQKSLDDSNQALKVANERRQLSEDKLAADLQDLNAQASSSASIEELRQSIQSLQSQPRIFHGPTPPPEGRDGDVWMKHE